MYDKIQFLAYELYTGPEFLNNAEKVYLGLPSEFDDVAARLAWLSRVVEALEKNLRGDKGKRRCGTDENVLRVFMIPEFFMRGVEGAYDMDTVGLAVDGLVAMAGDARFKDWLFVFGTIVGRSFRTIDRKDGRGPQIDRSAPVETYNFCPVVCGGWDADGRNDPAARSNATRVVLKEHLSNIDFIKTTADNGYWARVAYLPPAKPPSPGAERQRRGDDGAGIFTVGGITFGLEVCLDHAAARLKDAPPLPGESLVQVQLIPSCGMSIRPASVVAITGGWVYNVDGYLHRHTDLEKVARESSLDKPIAELGAPEPKEVLAPPEPPENFDDLYAKGSGKILIYSPVDVPPARTA